jgi:pilus assembly protein CpaC
VTSTISGTISNLLPKLNWAKNHGHARVLESSSLIVQDGRKGTINAGSKIPIKNTDANGTNTQLVDIGLFSTITPTIVSERSDSINLDIAFEILALTGNTSQGPLISKNTINTALTVRSGQSAAIGGLIRSNASTVYNDPKNLPNNPILKLHASKDFQRNQSQFVVFITPIIKSSASAGSEKIKKKFRLRD